MTATPDLFNFDEGQRRRDEGTAAVTAAAEAVHRSAKTYYIEIIQRCAEAGQPFTSDDVTAQLPDDVEPHSPNLLPALMQGAAKRGLIQMHGFAHSTRPSRHASRVCVWIGAP